MKYFINGILFFATLVMASCNNTDNKTPITMDSTGPKPSSSFSLGVQPFGTIGDKKVLQYTITNPSGMIVKIINYGGIVTNILVPDKNGAIGDVVLGYDSLTGYLQTGNPYMGALVGRYANRIANGKFTLEGKTYTLAKNNNGNTLHGGLKGFDKVIWESNPLPGDSSISFGYSSKDGEEGFPGAMRVDVKYTLSSNNELIIDYSATSDKATPINLTNHSYFNLSAGIDSTILDHELMLKADKVTAVNDKLIPTGVLSEVKNGPMDFNVPKRIGNDLAKVEGGYDHNWVLRREGAGPELIGTVFHPGSGRFMEVYTTEPGMQFYTGNFLDGTLLGKYKKLYVKHSGLCLEAQHFPDSPNQPAFPNSILKPGDTYKQTTVYKFSVK